MNISDKDLLTKVSFLVKIERRAHFHLLEHLQEVQRRRLYADLGYSSMFKYLTRELKYSEGAAVRRVNTLRLSNKVPAVKKLIQSGELSLEVASKAQNFSQNLSPTKTKQILQKLKFKSNDEAKRILNDFTQGDTAAMPLRDIKKPISNSQTRVHLTLENKTLNLLEKFKAIKKFNSDEALLFLLNLGFEEIDSKIQITKNSKGTQGRSIPSNVKKEILKRSNYICEFKGCDEIKNLEFEHIIPFAKGGLHTLENIKLYCRTHNQRSAIKAFGQLKMDQYLN
tara:strand:+ start:79392 stop:80237 length:846 start_codon:yes stop_codon:yes gene_type:complete